MYKIKENNKFVTSFIVGIYVESQSKETISLHLQAIAIVGRLTLFSYIFYCMDNFSIGR